MLMLLQNLVEFFFIQSRLSKERLQSLAEVAPKRLKLRGLRASYQRGAFSILNRLNRCFYLCLVELRSLSHSNPSLRFSGGSLGAYCKNARPRKHVFALKLMRKYDLANFI